MGVRLVVSFAAGFVSVVTPCVLPLVPGYLSAVSGVGPDELGSRGPVRRAEDQLEAGARGHQLRTHRTTTITSR